MRRTFSTAVAQVEDMTAEDLAIQKDLEAEIAKAAAIPELKHRTLWEISDAAIAEKAEKVAAEAGYLENLKKENNERGVYKPFEADANDIPAISKIKNRINQVVEKELVLQDFKDQINQEALAGDTYNEVITRSNFFFQVDENKVSNNLQVHDITAPGNKFRKPSVILPHEHIAQTGYMDPAGLTEDKEFELFGYYSYMVDLHIAQIRPDNLDEVSYVPKRFNQVEYTKTFDRHLNNRFFEYYHRWREPTRTWFSQTQELDFQEQLKNRPTTSHYERSKYDVEWTND